MPEFQVGMDSLGAMLATPDANCACKGCFCHAGALTIRADIRADVHLLANADTTLTPICTHADACDN